MSVLLLLEKRGTITAEEASETLDGLLDTGWYCSPDRYATLVGELEELRDGERSSFPVGRCSRWRSTRIR